MGFKTTLYDRKFDASYLGGLNFLVEPLKPCGKRCRDVFTVTATPAPGWWGHVEGTESLKGTPSLRPVSWLVPSRDQCLEHGVQGRPRTPLQGLGALSIGEAPAPGPQEAAQVGVNASGVLGLRGTQGLQFCTWTG